MNIGKCWALRYISLGKLVPPSLPPPGGGWQVLVSVLINYSDSLSVLNVSTLLPAGMLLYNTSKVMPLSMLQ